MLIKVCGLRDPENICNVINLGIDLLGLAFCKESPRCVSLVDSHAGIVPDRIDEKTSEAVCSGEARRVGVFFNEMPQTIITAVYNFSLHCVQLSGDESPIYIDNLRRTLDPDIQPGMQIIKSIIVNSISDILNAEAYEGHADMFLFTSGNPACDDHSSFDWSMLEAYKGQMPFLLGGNIDPDDAERILSFHHPQFLGIDVGSRFEQSPAVMDIDKLTSFINKIRK